MEHEDPNDDDFYTLEDYERFKDKMRCIIYGGIIFLLGMGTISFNVYAIDKAHKLRDPREVEGLLVVIDLAMYLSIRGLWALIKETIPRE